MGTLSSKSTPGTDSAPASGPVKEGMIPFTVDGETFQTYYKTVGTLEDRTKRPLVVLHGGPGFSHDYMLPIGDLATYDRPVIFYDQIGSGRSTALPDKGQEFWTFDLFVDEAMNVVNHFGIADDFDIIGHSWGGILATELALRRAPPGLKHCVFTNTICVMKLYGMSRYEQCKQLPEWAQQELAKGFRDTPECRAAATEFAKLFQCRVNPQPAELAHSLNYGFNTLHIIRSM
jgi:proline-specific peptidase